MAMNQYDGTRQYTKYKRHVNNTSERVDASTVNSLQDDLNAQQLQTNRVKDTAFEERVYTIFENNLYTNAMFLDIFNTGEYVNMNESNNVKVDFESGHLTLIQNSITGLMTSTLIESTYGLSVEMNDFILIANEVIPVGASIKYYLENSLGERWPLTPNAVKTPMHLMNNLKYGFKVVVELNANNLGNVPIINGYAVLFWDAGVEEALGLTNPDLQRFP